MCGIVGAIAQRDVAEILLEGLRRLEYRGYWLRQRKNILCMAALVLLTLAGRRTVNLQKLTRIRMFLNTLWWCITASSKTMNRCVKR